MVSISLARAITSRVNIALLRIGKVFCGMMLSLLIDQIEMEAIGLHKIPVDVAVWDIVVLPRILPWVYVGMSHRRSCCVPNIIMSTEQAGYPDWIIQSI